LGNVEGKDTYKYEFDDVKQCQKVEEYYNDKLTTTIFYKDSLMIEINRGHNNKRKITYKYLFDKHHNWIKMIYNYNYTTYLTERTITYYP